MRRNTPTQEQLELDQIHETELQLLQREKASNEYRKRIAEERKDRECMMPPLEEIQVRLDRKKHEMSVTRGEVANELRTQNRSLLMLVLLVTATCTLVWWGLKLMQGN